MALPDFLIIGRAKAGTTSLFRWLGEHPEVFTPRSKEPAFFSNETQWARGLEWYTSLFDEAGERLTGEATVAYTNTESGVVAASRIAATLPDVRLIYLVRDPIERTRSHFRHEVQRGRESREFADAIAEPGGQYAEGSLYYARLSPYLDRFANDQILVVSFERLVGGEESEWRRVLDFLGLSYIPRPASRHNVTSEKRGFTKPMLWLWESGWLERLPKPRPARSVAKRILLRDSRHYYEQLKSAEDPFPTEVAQRIWEDSRKLESAIGRTLWPN